MIGEYLAEIRLFEKICSPRAQKNLYIEKKSPLTLSK